MVSPNGALRRQLEAGAASLDLLLTSPQIDRLLAYGQLIARWTQVYNLTAVRDASGILTQHLLDSLSLLAPLRRHTAGIAVQLLDVGSGAGLPGIPIAIAAPELEVTCVDAVGKKAGFIRQVIAELGLPNADARHVRIEDLGGGDRWDVITSRAFASLSDFVRSTKPLLSTSGVWVAMKGQRLDDELHAVPDDIDLFHVEPLLVPGLAAQRCLIWLRPREPASIGSIPV